MHFNWSQNLFGMDGQAYPPLHPWMCGLLSPSEGKVGTPLREVAKRMIFGGQQSTNSMYYFLPKSLLSWDSTNKFQHQVQKGVVSYISTLYQTDWFYVKNTNKQTDVHGRTEWESPTSLNFVLCVVIWMGCWVVNLFSTINREHSICTL
jgi:hypothetical protein